MNKFDVIVVGAGPGGYTLAAQLSANGKKVAIVERNKLGGTCVNIGCIPTKSLITSARTISSVKESQKYGVESDNIKLEVAKIAENAKEVSTRLNGAIKSALEEAGVAIFMGETAKFIDDHTLSVGSQEIYGEKIVLATGSRSRMLKIDNSSELAKTGKLIHSTSALKVNEIPESIVIVGSGIIALEFGYYFSQLGSKVTLLEYGNEAMPAYDRDLASEIASMLANNGVKIFTNVRFNGFNDKEELLTTVNGKETIFNASKYLVAIGRVPNSSIAQDVVELDQRGNIVVDEYLRTSKKHIYAMGDVTGKKMLSSVSYKHGDAIFQHIMDLEVDKVNTDFIPATLYISLDVASVGKNEEQLNKMGVEYDKLVVKAAQLPRMHAEQKIDHGFVKLLIDKKHEKLLGAHIILKDASLIINTLALAVSGKITLKDLFTLGHTHPTVSEAIYYALRGVFLKK